MLQTIIQRSIEQKLLVLAAVLALIIAGWYAMNQVPLDAVPDITNNQVQVVTVAPTSPPQEVEQQITFPVEVAMQNLPGVVEVRSISRYGLSVVTVVFEEDYPLYDARQLVKEQIDVASSEIPEYLGRPEMMPITTGLGEIYQYVLVKQPGYEGAFDLMDLRTLQDWIVKRQLGGTKGIIEVSSFGGLLKQYELSIDPLALQARQLTLNDVLQKMEANSENSGGSYIEKDNAAYYIRTVGRAESIEEIEQIVLGHQEGKPIYVHQVAKVQEGASKRYGAMTMDGKGEVVGGITLMLKGANSSEAISNVHSRIEEVRKSLPEGVDIYPYLDRSDLVARTTRTIATNLIEGGLIVIFVLVLLLGNLRAGLIVASVIPLSMLFAFILMRYFGVSANLMSLGAIDFGIIVDGAVIVVEGTLHYLAVHFAGQKLSGTQMNKAVGKAAHSMMKPASFGVLIILVVFLPILTLEGVEGKMFRPMALTMSFALIGAFILSITYVPAMSALFLKRKMQHKKTFSDRLIAFLQRLYQPMLRLALRFPAWILVGSVGLLMVAVVIFRQMGSEFVPTLDEGDLAMQMSIPPGSGLKESVETATQAEQILLEEFPEVLHVISKIGTAEVPTDPMAIEEADIMIILKPQDEWVSATNREDLVNKMDEALSVLMGPSFEFTQPIQLRFNELMTGVKADIAIKIFGEDTELLKEKADEAALLIRKIQGAGDVKVEQTEGLQQLQVDYDRQALARYGVDIQAANAIIRAAYAGIAVGQVFEGERRFDMVVRLQEQYRSDLDIRQLRVAGADGHLVPLSSVASIRSVTGPMQISREQAHRRINIGVNVRNRDIGSFIESVQSTLDTELELPPGYYLQYGGQFENLQRASQRLMIAVPVALGLILLLLYMSFQNIQYALLIFTGIPLAAIGGVLALATRGMPFSISAGVGFIALFGVAVLNGLVLVNELIALKKEGMDDMNERIQKAAMTRMRPVIMTALVAALGFLPMALSTSSGAEVQRPLATVVIGGLVTSTFLTLFVLPVLYRWFEQGWKASRSKTTMLVLLGAGIPFAVQAQSPLPLDSAMQLLEDSHPQIVADQWAQKAAQALEKNAWDLPATALSAEYGQFNTGTIDNAIQLQQGIHLPGRYARRKNWLKALTHTQKEQMDLRIMQLKKGLQQVYDEWCYYEQERKLWLKRDSLWGLQEQRMEQRLKAGQDDRLSVLQVTTERRRIQLQQQQYQQEQEALLHLWNYFLGADSLVYRPIFNAEPVHFIPLQEAPMHPEGRLLEQNIQAAEAYEKVAKTEKWPVLEFGFTTMTLIGERRADDPTQNYTSGDRLQFGSIGISSPFLFTHSSAEAQEAKIKTLEQKARLRDWKYQYDSQLSFWQKQMALRGQQLTAYREQLLQEAGAIENAATAQMREGLISTIEWTLLMDRAFQIRSEFNQKRWSYQQALTEIKYLTQQL